MERDTPRAPGSDAARPARDLEVTLARLLTVGTVLSAGVILIGVALYLLRQSGERLDYGTFRTHADELNAPRSIVARALEFDAAAVMQLGVLLLILTPIVRVGFTLVAFVIKRDWMYVVIAGIVFAVLCLGLLGLKVH